MRALLERAITPSQTRVAKEVRRFASLVGGDAEALIEDRALRSSAAVWPSDDPAFVYIFEVNEAGGIEAEVVIGGEL